MVIFFLLELQDHELVLFLIFEGIFKMFFIIDLLIYFSPAVWKAVLC